MSKQLQKSVLITHPNNFIKLNDLKEGQLFNFYNVIANESNFEEPQAFTLKQITRVTSDVDNSGNVIKIIHYQGVNTHTKGSITVTNNNLRSSNIEQADNFKDYAVYIEPTGSVLKFFLLYTPSPKVGGGSKKRNSIKKSSKKSSKKIMKGGKKKTSKKTLKKVSKASKKTSKKISKKISKK